MYCINGDQVVNSNFVVFGEQSFDFIQVYDLVFGVEWVVEFVQFWGLYMNWYLVVGEEFGYVFVCIGIFGIVISGFIFGIFIMINVGFGFVGIRSGFEVMEFNSYVSLFFLW